VKYLEKIIKLNIKITPNATINRRFTSIKEWSFMNITFPKNFWKLLDIDKKSSLLASIK
jgi:hypothetical protein